jgi:uncharacterized membrane protein
MGTTDLLILSLISLAGWIVVGIRLMNLCDASGVSNGWMSFVPFLNYTRWARLAGSNPWLVLLWILPIVGFILSLVWLSRISEATGTKSPWFIVYLLVILATWVMSAIFGGVLLWIVAVVLTVISIYALWAIFDPTKPIAAKA